LAGADQSDAGGACLLAVCGGGPGCAGASPEGGRCCLLAVGCRLGRGARQLGRVADGVGEDLAFGRDIGPSAVSRRR
jgi:hypothetical protein